MTITTYRIFDIKYDVEDEEPKPIVLPSAFKAEIGDANGFDPDTDLADYVSGRTGYTVKSLSYKVLEDK